jgi:hypothetical protein
MHVLQSEEEKGEKMKRVKTTYLCNDEMEKHDLEFWLGGIGKVEKYEEKEIPMDKDVLDEHSFDELMEAALNMVNGLWQFLKGFGVVTKFALITIWEGIRWLWSEGVGGKNKVKKVKQHGK